jgi:DNA-binding NarL/FixJ family response regulator
MALTKRDKEKLVLELYSQGKTYRQITEEARICPRDIKTILDKVVKVRDSSDSFSVSSQAYKFFSEGKLPYKWPLH